MKNQLQATASLYLLLDTDLTEDECDIKFNPESFAAGDLFYVGSDKVVHKMSVMSVLDFEKEMFIDNKKTTETELSGQI
jgi:hypothetical protein